ncbi:MAG: hypothetical protein IPM81_10765 [Saprospirales bacterium]|nr:hypothetical protein [Saprospirales bacterium]
MKIILRFALFLFFAAACDNTAPPPSGNTSGISALQQVAETPAPVQTLRGMYKNGGNGARWYDCASGKTYLVIDETNTLATLYRAACQPAPCPGESVYGVAQGRVSPTGTAGAASGSDGTLRISRVDTLAPKTLFNTCAPYDFWCSGTEPFWGMLISETDGGFFLKTMGDERGRTFPWSAPVQNGTTWAYTSSDPASGESLRVRVRREPCSDGMSERQYGYSVEIQLGDQTLRGCAVRMGDALSRE